jgi:DNA-binding CsgD family transcriptional regulator
MKMGNDPTANQNEERVIEKLDQALKLLGMMAVKGLSQTEQIATLSRIGLSPKDIAEIVGTTANTVRVALVSIRKAEAGGHKKKRSTTNE